MPLFAVAGNAPVSPVFNRSPNFLIRSLRVSVAFCNFFNVGAASGYWQVMPLLLQREQAGLVLSQACLLKQNLRIKLFI